MRSLKYFLLATALSLLCPPAFAEDALPRVRLTSNLGTIVLELEASRAPVTVENFLRYVDEGYYDGLIFHRVIPDFMIQAGGFTPNMNRRPPGDPIRNEADNGLRNKAGTIAMARTSDPNSATAQFFINLVDNDYLDHRDKTARGWGYAVFGRVVKGMNTVERIGKVSTGTMGPYRDVPNEPVVIQSARRVDTGG